MPDFKVTVIDNRVGFELEPYIITDCHSGDIAIQRAKAQACADCGLAFQQDIFGLVSIEEVDRDLHQIVV